MKLSRVTAYGIPAILACAMLLATSGAAVEPGLEKLAACFFTPEQVRQHYAALGLTTNQIDYLRGEYEKMQQHVAELKQQIEAETDTLVQLAGPERLDEAALTAQAERAMKLDRELKLAQLTIAIRIKNTLTPEQQAKLKDIVARAPAIHEKMKKALALVEQWQVDGRDLSAISRLKEEFDPLVKQGKLQEAEVLLDRALKLLEDPTKL